jgi:predicted SAM-dependent methyltransferase
MKYLNLGCGHYFSNDVRWTNIDFVSTGEGVIAHNLLQGIPANDVSFDAVYHSHVLEHFTKANGFKFMQECYRVLKPNGIIRIAIPDLEQIAKLYIKFLEQGVASENDEQIRANYNWMLIEMYDQTVRNHSGGEMADYLSKDQIINENFVFERIGEEGRAIRNYFVNQPQNSSSKRKKRTFAKLIQAIVRRSNPFKKTNTQQMNESIGKFRLQGEIHQWMYDRYSLSHLLKLLGFKNIQIKTAFASNIESWNEFHLDVKNNETRKPDSLFIEAVKI